MVENHRWLDVLAHLTLILGVLIVAFPVYIAFVASTHEPSAFVSGLIPLLPGDNLVPSYTDVLKGGTSAQMSVPISTMLGNSLIMALSIAVGKIVISILSAFAIVYFRFPFRQAAFWVIFLTLMLPVEVRIVPTFKVVSELGMLNSYVGLTVPLIASATATFLFRQVFLTIPEELMEAARIDGAGPLKFFWDVLLPMSRTNVAALFVILFIYGWNQYIWPILVTTDSGYYTIVAGIKRMADVVDSEPLWNFIMATSVLALLPPVVVVIAMQRLFVKGLVETEK
ncbi:sn-glycerol-3-phosphate ABC transporter permease UgpE [Seohaeicola zhoushanensis]|uniref:sn-glycerol-3-phosphate transport system permease protein UgpE n=1 Tax=Seohaeicola zhoushanensis TaxID=1569283 RepID=A0A8J3M9F2_9RHOB|nr:sn-glycerol-3-phosphate ABC transporter permease UgpE [Seohaeicola zhoushanensis]GHF60496.1 sn-glycerol-3-phosphate transport system permease protein UgpE [Seohaeicola zhoushanensis]